MVKKKKFHSTFHCRLIRGCLCWCKVKLLIICFAITQIFWNKHSIGSLLSGGISGSKGFCMFHLHRNHQSSRLRGKFTFPLLVTIAGYHHTSKFVPTWQVKKVFRFALCFLDSRWSWADFYTFIGHLYFFSFYPLCMPWTLFIHWILHRFLVDYELFANQRQRIPFLSCVLQLCLPILLFTFDYVSGLFALRKFYSVLQSRLSIHLWFLDILVALELSLSLSAGWKYRSELLGASVTGCVPVSPSTTPRRRCCPLRSFWRGLLPPPSWPALGGTPLCFSPNSSSF